MQQEIKQLSTITDFLTGDKRYKCCRTTSDLFCWVMAQTISPVKNHNFFFHNSITKFHYREAMKLQVLGLRD